jgi:hypothetical protein
VKIFQKVRMVNKILAQASQNMLLFWCPVQSRFHPLLRACRLLWGISRMEVSVFATGCSIP